MKALSDTLDIQPQIEELEQQVEMLRSEIYRNLTRWQRVQIARHPDRPYTLDYITHCFTDFVELHGDRTFRDDPAIVGGLATFAGRHVMVIGHQKGRDTKTNVHRNFGMPNPEGYRKAYRLMQMAEKFSLPVICFLDTPGAYPGLEAEERGQAEAIAKNLLLMSQLKSPIIIVVIGEGASGGALGIGIGNRVLMLENAWYSV
ncbi:MAG: acetyl-CoA carboxylase carboxyl transferase subunit alpha, partial [Bacteroidota bacterium]